jgi:hypothetical protein
MADTAGPENEPDAGNAASVLPPHLAALIGALNGPPDLARQHDKYLAYPDREEHGECGDHARYLVAGVIEVR